MTAVEADRRVAVVRAGMRWLGTPYRPCARVHGAGVDCINFVAAAFTEAGVIPPLDLGQYPPDWHLHRSEERMLGQIADYCRRLAADEAPTGGDIALFRFGRCVSHAALVVSSTLVLHAFRGRGVIYDDIGPGSALEMRLAGIWTLRQWDAEVPA